MSPLVDLSRHLRPEQEQIHRQALRPLFQAHKQPKSNPTETPRKMRVSEIGVAVLPEKSAHRNGLPLRPLPNADSKDALFRSLGKSRTTERGTQTSLSNKDDRGIPISVVERALPNEREEKAGNRLLAAMVLRSF